MTSYATLSDLLSVTNAYPGSIRHDKQTRSPLLTGAVIVISLLATRTQAGIGERFSDPTDGAFDASEHILEHSGVLPVPILVTEPALGYGGGFAAVYFDEAIASKNREKAADERMVPPNISAVGGFKTENGSWGAGAGMFRNWDNDRYRYLGGIGTAALNLDFYSPKDQPRSYQLEGVGLVQQFTMRLDHSDWMLGARYVFFSSQSAFNQTLPESITPRELDVDIGKLGLLLDFDDRDNILTPGRGTFFEMELGAARDWLGSSHEFESVNTRAFHYQPVGSTLIAGLRGDYRQVSEDTPFFAKPYIDLRGIAAMRYQDQRTAVMETELRWNLTTRWSLIGFLGAGRAYSESGTFSESPTQVSKGGGFRYLIARHLGLYGGIDVAKGPEENAVYIQVGSAWR